MRIFMTGATGFIGFPLVKELITAGHDVIGLARSEEGAKALTSVGAIVQRGSLEDTEVLHRTAATSEAVIHLGFIHDFSRFAEVCIVDKIAIEAIGSALAGTERPLIVTSGIGSLTGPGQLATEDMSLPTNSPFPRVSEQTAFALIPKGVNAAVMRLPQVHDTHKQGLVSYAIAIAREKGISAYIGNGQNRWSAAHVSDVVKLYRLAVEKHQKGARYHAVAEEGVQMQNIAEAIGQGLKIPVVSLSPEKAQAHFGWLARFAGGDLPASSAKTREKLDWYPSGSTLLEDLKNMQFS